MHSKEQDGELEQEVPANLAVDPLDALFPAEDCLISLQQSVTSSSVVVVLVAGGRVVRAALAAVVVVIGENDPEDYLKWN
jgi:hypothetical protein